MPFYISYVENMEIESMVHGVDGNNENNNTIKLKGLKQNVDLDKLSGLRKTEQNKPIFEKFDKNSNGILEQDEAQDMQTWLNEAAGNKKLSKREMKKAANGDETLFNSLSSLGKQQETLKSNKEYTETNGETTTHILSDEGEIIRYDETFDTDGNKITTFENGDKTIFDKSGKMTQKLENIDGKKVQTDFEYDGTKVTIKKAVDGKLNSITVLENKDGHRVQTKYNSQQDYDNGRPSEEITDPQNATAKKTTKFTYDADGNVKAQTTDSAGNITTVYKNSAGEEISEADFDKQNKPPVDTKPEVAGTYTVKKGEGINKIVKDALKEQGIENPAKEQLQKAREEFLEMNKDMVKTYQGAKKEWHGNKFFYVDDVVQIPKFSVASEETPVEQTEKPEPTQQPKPTEQPKPTQEPSLKDKLQQNLGKDFIVEEGNDGKVVIKDKDGNELPKATIIANNPDYILEKAEDGSLVIKDKDGNVLPHATKIVNDETSDIAEIEDFLKNADKDSNKKLDKTEFRNYINQLLEQYEIEIDASVKDKVDQLINDSFGDIDTNPDNHLTKNELKQKAQKIIPQLLNDIGDILNNTNDSDIGE